MDTDVQVDHPIQPLLSKRWSPYGFSSQRVSEEDLRAIFEAARWAPSSYNEQPWRFILGTKDDPEQFAKVLSCLVEANQVWAKHAPVLVLGCYRRNFARNGKPNAACEHDLGLAAANLTFEANVRGLYVHQMIGILPDRAREVFGIPEDAAALTGLAVGHPDPESRHLPDEVRARDAARRPRIAAKDLVFGTAWGKQNPLFSP